MAAKPSRLTQKIVILPTTLSGRRLCYLPFTALVVSLGTCGYAFLHCQCSVLNIPDQLVHKFYFVYVKYEVPTVVTLKLLSFGMWHHAVWCKEIYDNLEEPVASIFRMFLLLFELCSESVKGTDYLEDQVTHGKVLEDQVTHGKVLLK